MTGRFIVLEGIDGCGKTTQIQHLVEWLPNSGLMPKGAAVVCTREPGGTPLGRSIRELLLHTADQEAPAPTAELLLYAADRAQHVETLIRPSLERGDWVISDRFSGSTLAYQGYGRGLDRDLIQRLEGIATTGLQPDLTLWLRLSVQESLQRRLGDKEDRIEAEGAAFLERVAQGFAALAQQRSWCVVAADQSASAVRAALERQLQEPSGLSALFRDLIGQPLAVDLLSAALAQGRVAPAYLFAGPEGVGRQLAAVRFLEGLLADGQPSARERRRLLERNHPDLLWVEPTYQHQGRLLTRAEAEEAGLSRRTPPQLRLEQIRDIGRCLARQPVEAKRGMVVIEAAEAMAEAAANALLKTLEEPGHGVLILLTSAPERLLSTIRSRCQLIRFLRLNPEAMAQVLERTGATSQDAPELLALAAGSPGALIDHRRSLAGLPEELVQRLDSLPATPMEALALARDLCEALDGEQQLWLIGWWQHRLWRSGRSASSLKRLDTLRGQLLSFVQPRLAWEVALLDLTPSVS